MLPGVQTLTVRKCLVVTPVDMFVVEVANIQTGVWERRDGRWCCCDRKSRAACAQIFALWQQATIEITREITLLLLVPATYI